MGNARVFVFFDTETRNERASDARILVAPNKDRESNGNGQGNRQDGAQEGDGCGGYGNNNGQNQSNRQHQPADDDIPF